MDQLCEICDLTFSDEYPEVYLAACNCRICIYCAFGCLYLNNCLRCRQANCVYFTMERTMEQEWTRERLLERKEEFLAFYLVLHAQNPERYPLTSTDN